MSKNNLAKQLKQAKQSGFEEGLWSGEMIMIDICSVALHNCFGFGSTNPAKWDKLGAEIQRIQDELFNPKQPDEVSLGFEHMVKALVSIFGEEQRAEIECKYRNLLFKVHRRNDYSDL